MWAWRKRPKHCDQVICTFCLWSVNLDHHHHREPLHYCHCTIALCRFLFRKMSLGEFNLHVSFSLGLFVSDKNIWSALSLSLHIWVQVDCRPISKQIYKRTSSNSIRKKTGCDEYLEDHLNVASKNLAKYPFDEKMVNFFWKIFAPWKAGLTKMLIWPF